jgi:hypothetical protein
MTHHRSPEDIEHEINHERGRIKQTLGALGRLFGVRPNF